MSEYMSVILFVWAVAQLLTVLCLVIHRGARRDIDSLQRYIEARLDLLEGKEPRP